MAPYSRIKGLSEGVLSPGPAPVFLLTECPQSCLDERQMARAERWDKPHLWHFDQTASLYAATHSILAPILPPRCPLYLMSLQRPCPVLCPVPFGLGAG